MADIYVKAQASISDRANSTAYTVGQKVVIARGDSAGVTAKRFVWRCTVAGTSGAAVPTWATTLAGTTTDGTVTWEAIAPDNWDNAQKHLDYATFYAVSGDTVYMSNNHAETQATNTSAVGNGGYTAASPIRVIVVDDTVFPPTTPVNDVATVTTTSNQTISITGSMYVQGIKFNSGTGGTGGQANFQIGGTNNSKLTMENCQLALMTTSASGGITLGNVNTGQAGETTLKNCWLKFNAAAQSVRPARGKFRMLGGGILSGGVTLTGTFLAPNTTQTAGLYADLLFDGVDFTNLGSAINMVSAGGVTLPLFIKFRNCRFPANWTGALVTSQTAGGTLYRVEAEACDAGDLTYLTMVDDYYGKHRVSTSVYKNGGATVNGVAQSWRVDTTDKSNFPNAPFETMELPPVWVDAAGSKTVRISIASDVSLTDADIWMEAAYPSSISAPLVAHASDRRSNVLSAPLAQDTEAATWTGMAVGYFAQELSVTVSVATPGFIRPKVFVAKPSTVVYVDLDSRVT